MKIRISNRGRNDWHQPVEDVGGLPCRLEREEEGPSMLIMSLWAACLLTSQRKEAEKDNQPGYWRLNAGSLEH